LLWLHRFKPDTPPHPIYDFGFRNRTDICRGWIVSSLTRDGDAVNAGMELGDTIIAVNGRNVADYTWDEEYDIDKLPKLHLDIVGADGKEKHITLESKERW
jgi:C-terminal processing protease CtpA/Prc